MPRPIILFAHGAGAPSSSDWMRGWTNRLLNVGRVSTFDYPYMKNKRKAPDRLPVLIEAHKEALRKAKGRKRGPVILAGKSMGSRVGCHVSLEVPCDGLICFGYPLGKPPKLRDQVLLDLKAPILFIQGSRDPLCDLAALKKVTKKMKAPSELFVVEGGDHSLNVGKRLLQEQDITQADVDIAVLAAVRAFLKSQKLDG